MKQEKNRTFTFEDKEYKVLKPTLNIIREAKYKYAKTFTDNLKAGFITKKKMENMLFEADDSIFKSYVNRRAEILKYMSDTNDLLNKAEKPEELDYLAELMSTYRTTLVQEDLAMNNMFANTADQLAEDEKINFLAFVLTADKDGNKIWKTQEEYLNETDVDFVEACKYQVMCIDYNLEPNWEKELPETKARLKAIEISATNKRLEEEKKVEEEKKIEEQHKEKVKKKAKKKE